MSTIHRSVTILYLKVIAFKNNGKSYAFFKRSKNGYGYFWRSLINSIILHFYMQDNETKYYRPYQSFG